MHSVLGFVFRSHLLLFESSNNALKYASAHHAVLGVMGDV